MPVDSTHPEYDKHKARWAVTRSVVDSDAKKYIKDVDVKDKERNCRYREDAILTNFTARTKNALVGSVFRKEAEVQLPLAIEYLIEDATGLNISLDQLAQQCVGEVLETGRYGLLVDYPEAEEGLTQAQVRALNLAAKIYTYKAENIINWNVNILNGQAYLDMVVLKECGKKLAEDGFEWVESINYRVLKMIDGIYTQMLFNERLELISTVEPRQSNGAKWNTIPFVFLGADNNDAEVDNAPLYDLALLNIGHLKNSADYEESVHITGQPTLFISSAYSVEEFVAANPDGIKIGARAGHNLGEGGNANMLQAMPNQLADEAMKRKEQQAIMIGARLIQPQSGIETAEAARIRYASENSVLSIVVDNVSDGLELAIRYCAVFMGANPAEVVYELNREFYDSTISAQDVMAAVQLYNTGTLPQQDMIYVAKKAGFIEGDRIIDDVLEEISTDNPLLAPNE